MVGRDEILRFLRENELQVDEVVLGTSVDRERVADLQKQLAAVYQQLDAQVQDLGIREGDRVATLGSAPSRRGYPYSQGKIYEAQRGRDGLLRWRLVDTFGGTRAGRRAKFTRELQSAAPYPWLEDVHQNDLVGVQGTYLAAAARRLEGEIARAKQGTGFPVRYAKWKRPGGQSYRELLSRNLASLIHAVVGITSWRPSFCARLASDRICCLRYLAS
jgi:hypothetical protein